MWESLILLGFYLVVGLLCLAVAVWGVASGQFLTMDGLFLTLVCLALAAVFGTAFALSVRSGEFADLLSRLRRGKSEPAPATADAPVTPPAASPSSPPAKKVDQAGSVQKA